MINLKVETTKISAWTELNCQHPSRHLLRSRTPDYKPARMRISFNPFSICIKQPQIRRVVGYRYYCNGERISMYGIPLKDLLPNEVELDYKGWPVHTNPFKLDDRVKE